ncbi:MAG: hypothetical protein IKK61_08180 [Clostridia bacterium]|nr:hypothetical protein [Clostridia bacterium]
MAKVFSVELSDGANRFAELTLPATDYELLDALDKLQLQPGASPQWEIYEHTHFQYLEVFVSDCSLYELNSLSRKLGNMDHDQLGAFEGLFKMALDKREGPMSIADLFTYANNTDCCHVLNDVGSDDQLGRFYAVNGFIPELEDIPDFAFDRLDYSRIGKEMREAEHGVFTRFGYVLQNDTLKPSHEEIGKSPQAPDYTLRLLIGRYPFETGGEPEVTTTLDFPASEAAMVKALEHVGAASWEEVIFTVEDSAIPGFPEDMYGDSFEAINDYAQTVKEIQENGELTKFKAVVTAKGCTTISEALLIVEQLDQYFFEPKVSTPEDVARDEINATVSVQSIDSLIKHVNLYAYGRELMEEYRSNLTPFGLITPRDGQELEAVNQTGPQLSM